MCLIEGGAYMIREDGVFSDRIGGGGSHLG